MPEAKRQAVAELLNRINYRMRLGNFEMDMDDGALFYRTSIVTKPDLRESSLQDLRFLDLSRT